jgi:GNAT superfamily N-acetyltransferase
MPDKAGNRKGFRKLRALKSKLSVRDLAPALWPALEELFGPRGACGGCWCMHWRLAKDERWEDLKGAPAKRRMKALVTSGRARGAIAFAGKEPVGWVAYGPRRDFPRLDRARTLACDDAERVWSLPCFYIKPGWWDRGVAAALLEHALAALRKAGAEVAEGYPVNLKPGQRLPSAFAWTGTRSLFERAGFELAGPGSTSKVRMRRTFKGAARRPPTRAQPA